MVKIRDAPIRQWPRPIIGA